MFADAITAALKLPSRYDAKCRIDAIADKLVSMAEEGDIQAIRELGDRIDGKVAQALEVSGDMTMRHAFALPLAEASQTADEWARQNGR